MAAADATPPGDIFATIRATCAAAVAASGGLVAVDAAAAAAFAATLPAAVAADASLGGDGVDFPLALDAEDDVVDCTLLFALLAFGSGFRRELHAALGAGASDTMVRGQLKFYLEGRRPTAGVLAHFRIADVAATWDIPLSVDAPAVTAAGAALPGVTMSAPGPLRPLAEAIARVLTTTGAELRGAGAGSFAAFLRARAGDFRGAGGAPDAGKFVALLGATFAGFRDDARGPFGRVALYKKAQLAAKELARKFPASPVWGFAPAEVARLTCFADNVLPAVLRAAGVLVLAPALGAAIDAGDALPAADGRDALLRAAAVLAVDAVAAAAAAAGAEPATPARADELLWRLGKQPAYRALQRHATKDTVFY